MKAVLEVSGQLQTLQNNRVREHPLKVLGKFLYEESILDGQGRSLRYYEQSEADLKVGGQPRKSELRDDLRWVLVDPTNVDRLYHSPVGPLTRQELDLIAIPGASNLVNALLPDGRKPIKLGDSWEHDDDLVARLLGLDVLTGNDVTSKLIAVDDQLARISLSGKAIGAVETVVSEIEVSGKYNFDFAQKRVTWLTLSMQEKREIGTSTPGLNVTARLRMVIGSKDVMKFVNRRAIRQFGSSVDEPGMLEYRSAGDQFALLHDRRWSVFSEGPSLAMLRCIEDDRMIAQCNIRVLPPLGPGKALQMARFQQEIREALGDADGRIVDSRQSTNDKGHDVLRVVAAGVADNTAVQWIYYHVAHPEGKRISLVFTMSADEVERFAGEDLAVTESLSFQVTPPETSGPTAALEEKRR